MYALERREIYGDWTPYPSPKPWILTKDNRGDLKIVDADGNIIVWVDDLHGKNKWDNAAEIVRLANAAR